MVITARNARFSGKSACRFHAVEGLLTKACQSSRLKGCERKNRPCCRLRARRRRRPRAHRTAPRRQDDGGLVGVSRRQDRGSRTAGTNLNQRVEGGTGNRRQRGLSRAAHFRQPQLCGLSSPDAAVCLPALGGNGRRDGRSAARLGEAKPAEGLRYAASGRSTGVPLAGAAVMPANTSSEQESPMRRFIPKAQFRRLLAAQDGTTAIEYAIIASGIAGVLIATVANLRGSLKTIWTAVAAALQQRPRCPQTRPFVVSASP